MERTCSIKSVDFGSLRALVTVQLGEMEIRLPEKRRKKKGNASSPLIRAAAPPAGEEIHVRIAQVVKGAKTRRNKRTSRFIVRRRDQGRRRK